MTASKLSSFVLGSAALVLSHLSGLAGEPLRLVPGADPIDYFRLSSGTGRLEVKESAEGAVLNYTPQLDSAGNSTLMAIIAPQQQFLRSPAESITLDFRISGVGSFGIQWRAEQPQSAGYLVLLNQWPNDRGTARLFRTRMLPPSGSMQDDIIGKKEFQRFNGKEWHRLEITTRTVPEGIEVIARITEIGSGREVVLLQLKDTEFPLEVPGLIALRFFMQADAETEAFDRLIEVRALNVEPEMN